MQQELFKIDEIQAEGGQVHAVVSPPSAEITHLDLFSGIGGFALAAKWAFGKRHRIVAFIEKDFFCQKVLNKNFPNAPIYGDIKHFSAKQYAGAIKLLTGGFPCQPFSVLGKREGTKDARHLWPEMLRIIRECKPTWIIGENVARFQKVALDEALFDLEGAGYEAISFRIPACAIGAPHRRDRIWIIGHADSDADSKIGKIPPDSSADSFGKHQWFAAPRINRMPNGLPDGMDRLRALGNAIVPQVVYEIMRGINLLDSAREAG